MRRGASPGRELPRLTEGVSRGRPGRLDADRDRGGRGAPAQRARRRPHGPRDLRGQAADSPAPRPRPPPPVRTPRRPGPRRDAGDPRGLARHRASVPRDARWHAGRGPRGDAPRRGLRLRPGRRGAARPGGNAGPGLRALLGELRPHRSDAVMTRVVGSRLEHAAVYWGGLALLTWEV